jgi:hypothetical protein
MVYYKRPFNRIVEGINALAPGASYSIKDDYESIVWLTPEITKPSKEAVMAKGAELDAIEAMRHVREIRDKLLKDTDWVVVKYAETGSEIPSNWKSYRQQLRNITNNCSPYYQDDKILAGVNWPEIPQ